MYSNAIAALFKIVEVSIVITCLLYSLTIHHDKRHKLFQHLVIFHIFDKTNRFVLPTQLDYSPHVLLFLAVFNESSTNFTSHDTKTPIGLLFGVFHGIIGPYFDDKMNDERYRSDFLKYCLN